MTLLKVGDKARVARQPKNQFVQMVGERCVIEEIGDLFANVRTRTGGRGTVPLDCLEPDGSSEPDPFDLAINRLLDTIEGTDLDDDFDLHELRGAAHDAENAMIDFACTPAYKDWPLREARLVGALCRLAGEMTAKPTLIRTVRRKGE